MDVSNHVKFVINIGPYLAVGMGGKYELTNKGGHKGESHNPFKSYSSLAEAKNKDALLKRFDIGVQGGIGFEIWKHYLVNASFQHGFMEPVKGGTLYAGDTEKHYPIGGILTVGYRF
jgi:hypothetical protein